MLAQSSGWIVALCPSLTPPISAGLGSSTRCDVQAGPGHRRLAGRQAGPRSAHQAPIESDQGCSEDGTRVPDDWLFAVGKTLSGLYTERKTRHGDASSWA